MEIDWLLIAFWCALLVIAALLVRALPSLILQQRLAPFWEGAGLARRVTVVDRDGQRRVSLHYPKVSRVRLDRRNHLLRFRVRVDKGNTLEGISAQADALAQHLGVEAVTVTAASRPGLGVVTAYRRDPDPEVFSLKHLYDILNSFDYFSTRSTKVPIGMEGYEVPFFQEIGHTLILATTGAGKGSIKWSYLIGADAVLFHAGIPTRFYAWDPKHAEFAGVRDGAFEKVAFTPEEGLDILNTLLEELRRRQGMGERTFRPSVDEPVVFLAIDEFNSIFTSSDTSWRKEVQAVLHILLSQGRSAGIYLVVAAQHGQKELLGNLRPLFHNRIVGRVESSLESDLALGAGSGADAHLIAPATESNGYRTAGIAYARSDSEPTPTRFRAPLVTDSDIAQWLPSSRRAE